MSDQSGMTSGTALGVNSGPPTGDRSPRVVAFLNQKGGVGKTTSTVNLGAALAREGLRVCLIDLDPQGHLTLHLGIDPERITRTVYDLMTDDSCQARDVVIRDARPNLDAILAEVDLAGAEQELIGAPDRQAILRRKFAPLLGEYDAVFIDCPPSLGLLTMNALTMAGEIFVPMQTHFLALQGVGRLLETVGLVCRSINPKLRVSGILLCMHEQQTTLGREILADLDSFFEAAREQDVPWNQCRVLRPPIRRNIKLAEAPSFGGTIFDYAPWCPGALDYRRLAQHLIRDWGMTSRTPMTDAPPTPARRGASRARAADAVAPPAPGTGETHADPAIVEIVTPPSPDVPAAATVSVAAEIAHA